MRWDSFFYRALCSPVLVLSIGFFSLSSTGFAQSPYGREEMVFTIVEHQPQFPGGYDSLKTFLLTNVRYPAEAQKARVKGLVYVSFIVETDGRLTDPQLIEGIGHGCDEEAMRVVNLMPKWIPGNQSGRRVRVRYKLFMAFPYTGQPDCGLYVEKQPEFPGGQPALISYLKANVHYPAEAQQESVKGRVFLSFDIDTVGAIRDVRLLKGIGYGCDAEALRVVNAMPKWQPGCLNRKLVRIKYNLPILFGIDYPTGRNR